MSTVRDYLSDMLRYLDRIARYTAEGREVFLADEKTQDAVIRDYEVIGEIAKRLPQDSRAASSAIDWKRLIGFRDFLAHNYEEIILEFVWQAVIDVPNLRHAIQTMLDTLSSDDA